MDSGAIVFFTGFAISIGMLVVLIELIVMCFIGLFSRKEKEMFKDQIEAGAKLLDEKIPDWLEKQDLDRFDISSSCNCVVGQAYPHSSNFWCTVDDILFPDHEDRFQACVDHGFAIRTSVLTREEGYKVHSQLTDEWKAYITDRRSHVSTN